MKSKQVMFFALLEDIEESLRDIEKSINVTYYKAGLHDTKNITAYDSVFDIPNIGVVFSGDWNKIESYLVLKKSTSLNIREVPQRTGEMKFAIDQLLNLESIELKIGGIYREKENVIVAGRIATISEDEDSKYLYKLFSVKVKKGFNKIGSFYVGQKAEEKLKAGWRLVTNEKLSKEYDLK